MPPPVSFRRSRAPNSSHLIAAAAPQLGMPTGSPTDLVHGWWWGVEGWVFWLAFMSAGLTSTLPQRFSAMPHRQRSACLREDGADPLRISGTEDE